MTRSELQKAIHDLYAREHAELGERGTAEHLSRGQALAAEHELAATLRGGGVLVFPHAGVKDCGYQIAACVHAALDSGADRVLVVSVLHAFSEEMEEARRRVAQGGDPALESSWGIQGPGLSGRDDWRGDHALISWWHFWKAERRRRGLEPEAAPEVIVRYPYLAGGAPERLPGITELQEIARDAVIVSTADPFHHGVGYGDSVEAAFYPDEAGLARAKGALEDGIALLERGDYRGYNAHCVAAKSDARDAGQVFRFLRGPMTGRILDLTSSDARALYGAPAPTWVATALFEWRLRQP